MNRLGDLIMLPPMGAEERLAEEARRSIRERDAQAAKERAETEQRNKASVLKSWGVPQKDIHRIVYGPMEDWEPFRYVREYLEDMRTWGERPDVTPQSILVLSGKKGNGKTTSASYVLANPPRPWERRSHPPRFMHVTELLRVDRYNKQEMEALEKASALVIDDLGSEYIDNKGAFVAFLDGLVNARYKDWLTMVITTNLNAVDFEARYGGRTIDRLREVGRFVELESESRRGSLRP